MKVAVLVSGGVDSSVALARLRRDPDLDLTAFYLRIWLEDELAWLGECPWEEDLRHARSVCEQLGVPLEVVSLQTAYHERVVAHAIAELARGRTPSPDLHCNERVKFGAFMDLVGHDFDRVATGHYARVDHPAREVARSDSPPPSRLLTAADPVKDQTYFLARMTQPQLARVLFPIGGLQKAEVRSQARALGLSTQSRPDSQGICFLGKIPYPEFVRHHLGDRPGPIIDRDTGQTLGTHSGLWFHTIGQRKGMGLAAGPWFVVDKDPATQTLFVAHADRVRAHHRADFEVEDPRWLSLRPPLPRRLEVKLRHGPRRASCILSDSDTSSGRLRVVLDEADAGVAPGQFAVFYDGAECLGSGVIA